jgi:hypothetical protein
MSEIPFVNALGDAIECSAAAHIAGRRRRIRRRLTGGVLAFAVLASGVAAASGVFESATPEQLATAGISCYSTTDLAHANVSVLSTGTTTPIETCRRALGTHGSLVACAGPDVMVFPGPPGTCETLGLKPLPAAYDAARRKVNRLGRRIGAIEATKDCWDPHQLAARVQGLLDRTPGWRAWRTRVSSPVADGPCGSVNHGDGAGERSVDGMIDAQTHTVLVSTGAARSTLAILDRLDDLAVASTARCYDRAGAEALARGRLAASGRTVTFRIEHLAGGSVKAFQDRIDQGCSVIPGFGAAGDGYGIVVTIRE